MRKYSSFHFEYLSFFFLRTRITFVRDSRWKKWEMHTYIYIYRAVIGSRQDASKRKRYVGVHVCTHDPTVRKHSTLG